MTTNINWRPVLFVAGVIGFIGAVLGIRVDFPYEYVDLGQVRDFITDLPATVIAVLILILFTWLSTVIYYAYKSSVAPTFLKFMMIVAFIAGVLLISQLFDRDRQRKIVLVYDEETPSFHSPAVENVEVQQLTELNKLYSIGALDTSILISTVTMPELKWKKFVPKSIHFSLPIFSIQEVIAQGEVNIVDISLLDFSRELTHAVVSRHPGPSEIRIFVGDAYRSAAVKLKSNLETDRPGVYRVNIIDYDEKNYTSLLSKDIVAIFLLDQRKFDKVRSDPAITKAYRLLLVPNWHKPSILEQKAQESNRFCVSSSVFDRLVAKDTDIWLKLINSLNSEIPNANGPQFGETVKNKIRSTFATMNSTSVTAF